MDELKASNKLPAPLAELAKKLDQSIVTVLGSDNLLGFEKAFLVADTISKLKEFLTPEYMKPIMELQGNKLGFKTDKDKDGGYPEHIVKNCLIEAVLFGLQPYGNQFNIIRGNMYATKEGLGSLLKRIDGLHYEMTPELPRISGNSSATIMNVKWTLKGNTQHKKLEIPIKVDSFMGVDAILGKAQRKARKWLYDTITSSEIPEGDVTDTGATVISSIRSTVISQSNNTDDIKPASELPLGADIAFTPILPTESSKKDEEVILVKEIDYDALNKKEEPKQEPKMVTVMELPEPDFSLGTDDSVALNAGKGLVTNKPSKVKKIKNEAKLKESKKLTPEPKTETPVTPVSSNITKADDGGFDIEENPTTTNTLF